MAADSSGGARMEDNITAFILGIALGAMLTGLLFVKCVPSPYVIQSQAIKHGAAYYHPETGIFTWKDGQSHGN